MANLTNVILRTEAPIRLFDGLLGLKLIILISAKEYVALTLCQALF